MPALYKFFRNATFDYDDDTYAFVNDDIWAASGEDGSSITSDSTVNTQVFVPNPLFQIPPAGQDFESDSDGFTTCLNRIPTSNQNTSSIPHTAHTISYVAKVKTVPKIKKVPVTADPDAIKDTDTFKDTVFVYKLKNKWRLSPNFKQEKAWLFTKDGNLTDETVWYTFGKRCIPGTDKIKKIRLPTGFKLRGLKNINGNRIYDSICMNL